VDRGSCRQSPKTESPAAISDRALAAARGAKPAQRDFSGVTRRRRLTPAIALPQARGVSGKEREIARGRAGSMITVRPRMPRVARPQQVVLVAASTLCERLVERGTIAASAR